MNVAATKPVRDSWWRRRVLAPVVRQLTQGATPSGLAAALAVGTVIAINPFLGTVTSGCLVAGIVLRLNQPALQVANLLATPLQLLLLVPWVRFGEWMWDAPPIPLNPTEIVTEFSSGPFEFLSRFGRTGVHAASAWLFSAPVIAAGIFFPARSLLSRWKPSGSRDAAATSPANEPLPE